MTEGIWIPYNSVMLISIQILIFSVIIAILYIHFNRGKDKAVIDKKMMKNPN